MRLTSLRAALSGLATNQLAGSSTACTGITSTHRQRGKDPTSSSPQSACAVPAPSARDTASHATATASAMRDMAIDLVVPDAPEGGVGAWAA